MKIPLPKFPCAKCQDCPLKDMNGFIPTMEISPTQNLVVIGTMPSYSEIMSNTWLNSETGEMLANALPDGVIPYYTTVIKCRTPNNRTPTQLELDCCKPALYSELIKVPGSINILTLGDVATKQVLDIYAVLPPSDKISKIRGSVFEGNGGLFLGNPKIIPTYAPAFVLNKGNLRGQFDSDVLLACGIQTKEDILSTMPEVEIVNTWEDIHLALNLGFFNTECVAFDIETRNLQWYTSSRPADNIIAIGLARRDKIIIIEWSDELQSDKRVIETLQKFFTNYQMVAHNGKFDQLFLREHLGINFRLYFDTLLAHAELEEESPHGLKELASNYFGIPDYEAELIAPYLSKNQELKDYNKIPKDILYKYLAIDLWVTFKLKEIFEAKLFKEDLAQYFFAFVMDENETALEMQFNGLLVDTYHLDEVKLRLEKRATVLKLELQQAANLEKFNPNSPQQVAAFVYDFLHLPEIEYKHKVGGVWKTDLRSTSRAILEKLPQTAEIVKLLEFKQISKLVSNYTDSILDLVDFDNRVHPDIFIFGTETGRWSVTNPPLHNIPRSEDRGENHFDYGGLIRSSFIAGIGRKLVICDYSQAELRILAALSGDSFLLDAYNNDRDLHTEMAKSIAPRGEWNKYYRGIAKKINFGFVYYAGPYIIAQQANIPIELARDLVFKAQKQMSRAVEWRAEQLKFAQKYGYVTTRFGKKRHIPIITDGNMDNMKKASVNSPIQGGAGQLTALAAHNILRRIIAPYNIRIAHNPDWNVNPVKLLLSVHDSIIVECDESEADAIAEMVAFEMTEAGRNIFPEVKWVAEPEISDRWAKIPNG